MTLLCLSKEESPEEKTPGRFAAHTPRDSLRASLRPGARLTRRAQNTRLGLKQKTRDYSRPGSVLGSLRRGFEQPTSGLYAQLFSTPLRRYLGWLDLSSVGARLVSMPIKKLTPQLNRLLALGAVESGKPIRRFALRLCFIFQSLSLDPPPCIAGALFFQIYGFLIQMPPIGREDHV
jgi:hypothetical protein